LDQFLQSGLCFCGCDFLLNYGSIFAERARLVREQADQASLKNGILRGEFLPKAELSRTFAEIADSIQQVVRNSRLNRQEQDDLLLQLSSVPVAIENTARAQTRWRGNGAKLEPAATETPKPGRGRPKNSHLGNRVPRNLA
jgi:phage terminase Nu1 subunit (DNA packaging protein)